MWKCSRGRILALAAFAVLTVWARAGVPPAQAAGEGPQIFQFALANGLQVVVIPDHRAPVVTQMLYYKVGAADDPPGLSGMAHFLTHMMFRGTKAVPGDLFAQTIARNGGVDGAFVTHDYTAYYERIAANRLQLVMRLEADRMANLDLSNGAVAAERAVAQEERPLRTDGDPRALTVEQMEAELHMTHPYGRPVLGWPGEARHIDRVSAGAFYDRYYAPNNAVLIVTGDVNDAEVRKLAQSEYGGVPAKTREPRAEFAAPPRLGGAHMTIRMSDVKVPMVMRLYRVASYAQARPGGAEGFAVLAQLLGGGETGALYRVLVEEKRLAIDAGAAYDGEVRDAAQFSVYAVPRPGVSLATLEKAVDRVIQGFTARPPAAAALARAKTDLAAQATYCRDDPLALARAYGTALMIGLTTEDVRQWPQRIGAVTGAGVVQAARGLLKRQAVTAYLEAGARE